ncbi:hypothetical protein OROGR_025917 [Orobanche gracilis]
MSEKIREEMCKMKELHPGWKQKDFAMLLEKNEENNPENDSIGVQKVSCEEALSLLDKLKMFLVQQEGGHVEELMRTLKLKDKITTQKIKSLSQSTLKQVF